MRAQYRIGDTGVLEHYPSAGRADAGTAYVTAYLYGTTTLFARELVTLDTVDTAATCAEGSQTVTVGSVAGLVRARRYWLVDALGNGHEVRLAGILGPTSVVLEEPARITAAAASGKLLGHGLLTPVGRRNEHGQPGSLSGPSFNASTNPGASALAGRRRNPTTAGPAGGVRRGIEEVKSADHRQCGEQSACRSRMAQPTEALDAAASLA